MIQSRLSVCRLASIAVCFIAGSASAQYEAVVRAELSHAGPQPTAAAAKLTPLALLDGDRLYMQWPQAAVTEPAIVAYDLSRKQILWQHSTGEDEIKWMYLTPGSLLYQKLQGAGSRLVWLNGDDGRVLHTIDEIPVRDQPIVRGNTLLRHSSELFGPSHMTPSGAILPTNNLQRSSELHDLSTGAHLGGIPDLNRHNYYVSENHVFDCLSPEDDRGRTWEVRQFDIRDGSRLRSLEIAPDLSGVSKTGKPSSQFWWAKNDFVLVYLYGIEPALYCLVDMANGVVRWRGEPEASYRPIVALEHVLVLSVDHPRQVQQEQPTRTLCAVEFASGRELWRVDVPPNAPLVFVDYSGQPVARDEDRFNLHAHPYHVDIATGRAWAPELGPSPRDRLEWQVRLLPVPLSLESRSIGSQHIAGVNSRWFGWDSATGKLAWTATSMAGPERLWLRDASSSPRFIVLAYAYELLALDAATGETQICLTPEVLGLQSTIQAKTKPIPGLDAVASDVQEPADAAMRRVWLVVLLALGLIVVCWRMAHRPNTRGTA